MRPDENQVKGMTQLDDPRANFAYWAKMASWTLWEAASLLVGINPQHARDEADLRRKVGRGDFELFIGIYHLVLRAYKSRIVSYEHTTPQEWLTWAKSCNLPISPRLAGEVEKIGTSNAEVNTCESDGKIAELQSRVARLTAELDRLRATAGQALSARERESLLKLVIGMAVAGYKYDPKARRGDSVKEITDDLDKLGVRLSDDTIRKFLRVGADLLPPQENGAR